MKDVYSELQNQPFPCLGETLEIAATKFEYHLNHRRSSIFLQITPSCGGLFHQQKEPNEPQITSSARIKRIKRPIDFRMDGSPICQLLTLDQIFMVYAAALQEKKLVVISSSLR
jgi:hypothetical protein